MIIGTCGFISTGSSAVSDYLKEFDDVCALDEREFQVVYFPDGLEDLDYHLNQNCSKYMSSVVAIERFRMHVYNNLFYKGMTPLQRKAVIDLANCFIKSITQVKWRGRGDSDYQLYCSANYKRKSSLFLYKNLRKFHKLIYKYFKKECNFYPMHDMQFSIQPDDFDRKAKKFVTDLLKIYGADFSKKIVLDQPFSGNDPEKSFKFFEDPKAIVVDRDPRDHYLFSKVFLKTKGTGYQIPTNNVRDYVEYYKKMRKDQPYITNDDILKITFEDMVYNYDQTTEKINKFCSLDPSKRKRRLFAPEMSINNTQIFKKYPEYADDIKYIEDNLSDYLFPFEKYGEVDNSGQMFFGKSPLNK